MEDKGSGHRPDDAETFREGRKARARPSELAGDRYRPIREIARGGMGRVIEALDTQLNRLVALKEILDEHPEARARFDREVEITARLEHPSIVPLYDAGHTAGGAPFYVMRKVSGEPLADLINSADTLDQRLRLLPNVLALADAVAHAHGRGVIHRDLKPTNVLVGELGETVVIDWGLAKLIGEADEVIPERHSGESLHTRAGTVFGTPGFMPPEQLRGDPVDERADVYALGGCLYHVLAGERPPEGTPTFELTGAPTELVTITRKAMAPERTDRYLDAGGFSEDLRRFLGGQLVAAHHYSLHQRALRWLRRHRAIVAVATIALAVSIAGGTWAVQRIITEQTIAEQSAERAAARADELVLFQAFTYADSNPTLAIASLQQLPTESPRWTQIGSLLAGLRARGVARGYAGPGKPIRTIDVSRVDGRVLVSGLGGAVLIDPVEHTSELIDTSPVLIRAIWWRDKIVLDLNGSQDQILDPVTRSRTPTPWPPTARGVELVDDGGARYTEGNTLVVYDRAGVRSSIDFAEPLRSVTGDPTGTWVAATSKRHVYLLRASQLVQTFELADATVAFDGDRRIAMGADGTAIEYSLAPLQESRRWTTDTLGLAHYVAGKLHWWTWENIRTLEGEPRVVSRSVGTSPETALPDGRIARLVDNRTIELVDGPPLALHTPELVEAVAAGKRFLVAAGAARVFVWDLDDLTAARTLVRQIDHLYFLDPDQVIGISQAVDAPLRPFRILPSLAIEPAPELRYLPHEEPRIGHGIVALLDYRGGKGEVIYPRRVPIELAALSALGVDDARSLVAGTRSGTVHRIDPDTGQARLVATAGEPLQAIAARGGWIVAITDGGRLWRRDPDGGTAMTRVAKWLSPSLAPDGVLYTGRDNQLFIWPVAGEPAAIATLARPVRESNAILFCDDRFVVIVDQDGTLYRHDRRLGITTPWLSVTTRAIASRERTTVVAAVGDGIVVGDVATGTSFRLVERMPVLDLAISPDGTRVLALTAHDQARAELTTWRLDPPTRAWVMTATNASLPERLDAPIRWR